MEWFRWIATIVALGLTAYYSKDYGRTQMLAEIQAQAITKSDAENKDLRKRLEEGKERAEQERADLVAMQTALTAIERRTSGIGGALQRALNESQMGTCVLDDAVRGVRADAYKAAADATAAANRARGDGR